MRSDDKLWNKAHEWERWNALHGRRVKVTELLTEYVRYTIGDNPRGRYESWDQIKFDLTSDANSVYLAASQEVTSETP